ncbi:hypothetical protein [Sphaerisporangium siamense]|uniref:Uncharacterized protein n=1 Tax=Sphaerisporangium siamense TaxID=795645 RepID=A0A7W7D5J2_9ACTN|nr:hypothetical protein [Sphaerisporangium siamense]MBB4700633.1 hypothetical protein [Sphaerisporangium siamense]
MLIEHYKAFSDDILNGFLQHFTITSGDSFEEQRRQVIQALCDNFSSSSDDALDLHYGNAISYVMDLAMRPREGERKTTKSEFISRVNKRQMLFTRWKEEVLGREHIVKMIQKRLKATDALKPRNRRMLIIDGLGAASIGRSRELAYLIKFLATEHYGPGQLTSARPWTVVIEGTNADVEAIKAGLIDNRISFNDGYEGILFSPEMFDAPPITNTTKGGSKISRASYSVRLVSAETYVKHVDELKGSDLIISFSNSHPDHYSLDKVPHGYQINLTDLEEMVGILRRKG